jgi:hypothetical protein
MANGRSPFKSTWVFQSNVRNSGKWTFLRPELRQPPNTYEMWRDWYINCSDGIGFGILKRWNGTSWVECTKFKVHAF